MSRSWWLQFSLLALLATLAITALVPTFFKVGEDSRYPFKSKLNLGLDLQGGLYMVLGIDFNKVYRSEVESMTRKLLFVLEDSGISAQAGTLDASDPQDPKHSLTLSDATQLEQAKAKIKEYGTGAIRLTGEGATELEFGLVSSFKTDTTQQAVSKSIEVIRNRIDEFGVTEPEIIALGTNRIVVQLPGVKDIERAKSLIGTTAKLEFKLVNDEVSTTTIANLAGQGRRRGNRVQARGALLSNTWNSSTISSKPICPRAGPSPFRRKTTPGERSSAKCPIW